MNDSSLVSALSASLPAVVVCALLLLLFLATQTVRLVLPGERLVVRRDGTERVAGPGLRLVRPGAARTRVVPARILTRQVSAHGVEDGSGTLSRRAARVQVLVGVDRGLAQAARDVDVSTRRALRGTSGRQPDASAGAAYRHLRSALAAELSRRGLTLVDVRTEPVRPPRGAAVLPSRRPSLATPNLRVQGAMTG